MEKALFLSEQLNINEHVAATLLMRGINESARVNSNAIDTAILLYYGERGYLLACLDVILKSAKDASISEEVRRICYQFMAEITSLSVPLNNNATGGFVAKLLNTLEELSKSIVAIKNTGTIVGQVPEAGSGKLGENVSQLRIDRLGDERVYIVQILYHIASLFRLNTDDKIAILTLLEEAELTDPATTYVLMAMVTMISFENRDQETPDMTFVSRFHNRIMTHGSRVPVIKAVIVIQWILYLSNPIRYNKVVDNSTNNRRDSDIQELLEIAIATDVFGFMDEHLLYFQQLNAATITLPEIEESDIEIDYTVYHNVRADVRSEFHPFVLYELEALATSFIDIEYGFLQKLKYKEEDTEVPFQSDSETMITDCEPCTDLAGFLTFLASVYRDRVDAGIAFWKKEQGGLNHFTRWLMDIKVTNTVIAAFDFLGSIATGADSANHMYEYFSAGVKDNIGESALFSWGKPFSALQFYTKCLQERGDKVLEIPTMEEKLIIQFLNILKQTVQYSRIARLQLWSSKTIYGSVILLEMLNQPTSIPLRAALYNVLAAFGSSWGGSTGQLGLQIAQAIWQVLGESDLLQGCYKVLPKGNTKLPFSPSGMLTQLEKTKKAHAFTETLAAVRLIASLIHTRSKSEAINDGFPPQPHSIPAHLVNISNQPGSIPYITLVVDRIFIAQGKENVDSSEARLQVVEACLRVMDNSVTSFDLSKYEDKEQRKLLNRYLERSAVDPSLNKVLLEDLIHPGFQVMIRILAGGAVVKQVFDIIHACAVMETKEVNGISYSRECLVHCLRILLKISELQNTFCKVLIPYIIGFSQTNAKSELVLEGYAFSPLPSLVSLGQLMMFNSEIVERIALLVNYEDLEEVCLLSTRILQQLTMDNNKDTYSHLEQNKIFSQVALSTPLTNLVSTMATTLDASAYSETIVFGVSERLSIDLPEVITCEDYEYDDCNIPFLHATETINNVYNYPIAVQPSLTSSVRLAILDLLLENAKKGKPSPSLTEYLLGYQLSTKSNVDRIQDTEENKPMLACFHVILSLLNQGMEKHQYLSNAMVEDNAEPSTPLIDTHPILAEKCYQLIYLLCANESLSSSTMRYLRNRENYFYKQFDAMSSRLEHNMQTYDSSFPGVMVCADGTQVTTDFFRLRSKLYQRAWILKCVALELHTTIGMQQKNEARRLLNALYGSSNILTEDDMDTQGSGMGMYSTSYQQPLVKILEIVSSLEFVWKDELLNTIPVSHVEYFQGFTIDKYEILNERGCRVYNAPAIYEDLKELHRTTYEKTPQNEAADIELRSIVDWSIAQNHTREINHGQTLCLDAWKQVIHVTFIECCDLIGLETRENMIYELLNMLLHKILLVKKYNGQMHKSMSETVLALLSRLKKDKIPRPASELPTHKLKTIFYGLADCICEEKNIFEVRGDLYTSMTCLLLYINGHGKDNAFKELEHAILERICSQNYRLLDVICTDTVHSLDIWRTTAYICLDALNKFAFRAGNRSVQAYSFQKNFLQYTIESIRIEDAALTTLLEQHDGKDFF